MSDLPPADESVSDDALARAFIAGDASAMEALYRRHRRQMFGWIARTLPDRSEVEDAYQEVWLRVLRGIDGYKPGNFKAWLWSVARNCVTDRLRKRLPELVLDEPVDGGQGGESMVDGIGDDSSDSVLEKMDAAERRGILKDAVAALSAPLRDVVAMRINGEMEFHEIASVTGLPLGTVLGRMHQAVKKLREIVNGKERHGREG